MSQKKKLIGIPGFANKEQMFGVTGNYMKFAAKYGDVRIIMPHEELVEVDLLLLPGGLDLSPSSYGRVPDYKTTNHDVFKEYFFKNRLENYIKAGIPIFGICLGFQMINVHFGGTLTQHLTFHPQSSDRWQEAHEVVITNAKKDDKLKKVKVNSHHHQAVVVTSTNNGYIGDMAEGFYPVAHYLDVEGFVIEAFKHRDLPIAGVQFHPEELYDVISDSLIKNLLKDKE